MKKLIDDAVQLIADIGEKQASFIHHVLKWDDDMKCAFMLAYQVVNEKCIRKSKVKNKIISSLPS
jgi:hypothetical protein